MAFKVLQLTDLHLFWDPQRRLRGVPTRDSFRDVLAFIQAQHPAADLWVLSGDLAHDELLETYQMLRDLLGDQVPRCRLIPGNHENREHLRRTFHEVMPPGDGPVTFTQALGDWQLIGLDSHDPGKVSGRMEKEQVDWLDRGCVLSLGQPTVVFLHHPPIPVGCAWLEPKLLHEPGLFLEVIAAAPQVRIVATGHIHQDFEAALGQARLLAAPSTAVQFTPRAVEFHCDHRPPGFRVFTFEGDSCRTQIERLPELRFPPQ